eukprot:4433070-Pyramimonas_sp.AAC.1
MLHDRYCFAVGPGPLRRRRGEGAGGGGGDLTKCVWRPADPSAIVDSIRGDVRDLGSNQVCVENVAIRYMSILFPGSRVDHVAEIVEDVSSETFVLQYRVRRRSSDAERTPTRHGY